jgi:hypothetical protein
MIQAEDGPHVQGVLNLLDNTEEDGGTQLVPGFQGKSRRILQTCWGMVWLAPGFHNIFAAWQSELGNESARRSEIAKRSQFLSVCSRRKGMALQTWAVVQLVASWQWWCQLQVP